MEEMGEVALSKEEQDNVAVSQVGNQEDERPVKRPKLEDASTREVRMEELMAELVGLILGHVDQLSVPCCRFVCRRWNHILTASFANRITPPSIFIVY
jgi:hypothetical protein